MKGSRVKYHIRFNKRNLLYNFFVFHNVVALLNRLLDRRRIGTGVGVELSCVDRVLNRVNNHKRELTIGCAVSTAMGLPGT
jgi:hypothetical protein